MTLKFLNRILFVASAMMLCQVSGAQSKVTVSGTVYDDSGQTLPGASVLIEGTATGTATDIDGRFSISALPGKVLVVQFLGCRDEKITVPKAAGKPMKVVLLPDASNVLQEAVTIAYGSVRKEDLTGSVTNVKMADLKDSPVLSIDQALQGRIAGADIMTTTGEPGSSSSIRIRGTRSINASNEPLYVVDGVMDAVSDLGDINPADIESMTVLKDASSTAIYGSRGSNGVIIITTRQGDGGKQKKPRITFKAEYGFSQLPKGLDLMNASEYAQYRNDIAYFSTDNSSAGAGSTLSEYPYPDPISKGEGTDWIKAITQTSTSQNYNFSIGGGDKRESYLCFARLQQHRRHHQEQRIRALVWQAQPRPRDIQVAQYRLQGLFHPARPEPQPCKYRRHFDSFGHLPEPPSQAL